jgi:hypothetical protein
MLPNLDAIVYAKWFSFLNRSLTCLHEQMEIQISNRLIWGRDAAVKWDDRGLAVGIAHNINAKATTIPSQQRNILQQVKEFHQSSWLFMLLITCRGNSLTVHLYCAWNWFNKALFSDDLPWEARQMLIYINVNIKICPNILEVSIYLLYLIFLFITLFFFIINNLYTSIFTIFKKIKILIKCIINKKFQSIYGHLLIFETFTYLILCDEFL